MLWESQTETLHIEAFQEAVFISLLAAAQQIHIQRLSLENKGVSPLYTLASRLQKQKARFNTYMVAQNSMATSPPVLCDLLHI
jgi:hypothetical protein